MMPVKMVAEHRSYSTSPSPFSTYPYLLAICLAHPAASKICLISAALARMFSDLRSLCTFDRACLQAILCTLRYQNQDRC